MEAIILDLSQSNNNVSPALEQVTHVSAGFLQVAKQPLSFARFSRFSYSWLLICPTYSTLVTRIVAIINSFSGSTSQQLQYCWPLRKANTKRSRNGGEQLYLYPSQSPGWMLANIPG